jgi:phosphatidylglycerophosphate synthase
MTQTDSDIDAGRRPLTSREHAWAHNFSTLLANTGITPNQISFASVVLSVFGLVLLSMSVGSSKGQLAGLYIAAAFACQLRLLCNLMDGMVAIELGKQTADGALWNEFPDRLADIALLLGVGIAAGEITLAWTVVALAILVAYVRELGKGIDGVADFSGPMAKPHRMALITAALVLSAIVAIFPVYNDSWLKPTSLLLLSLWICGFGCVVTVWRRISHLLQRLKP